MGSRFRGERCGANGGPCHAPVLLSRGRTPKLCAMKTIQVGVNELGESLCELRLRTGLREMAGSLRRHGQLTAVLCCRQAGRLEVADGFKRVAAARALGVPSASVHENDCLGELAS